MNKIVGFIMLAVSLLIFAGGCSVAQVRYKAPGTRFFLPESTGDYMKVELSAKFANAQKVRLLDISKTLYAGYVADPETSLSQSNIWGGQGSLGIARRVDISISSFSGTPTLLGIKFQFLGTPENLSQKGWKASVAARYGRGTRDDETIFSGKRFDTRLKSSQSDINLIAGYRLNPFHIVYATAYWNRVAARGRIRSTVLPTIYNQEHSSDSGALLGYRFSSKGEGPFFAIEAGTNKLIVDSGQGRNASVAGISVGVKW